MNIRLKFSSGILNGFLLLLSLPLGGMAQMLDESWTISINGQSVQVDSRGSFFVPNISAPDQFGLGGPGTAPDFFSDDYVRAIGQSISNGTTRYAFSDYFQFSRGQTVTIGQMTITETPPPSPVSLRMTIENHTLSTTDQTTQLHVTGTLQDGSQVDLTPRTNWTVYRTSNPLVASVDKDGLVTAQGNGVAYLTAVNEGAAAVAQVIVALGPLMSIEGFVRFEDGAAGAGADISIFGLPYTSTSRPDGSFTISGVPSTITSNLTVRARITVSGTNYVGSSTSIVPVPDGIADAGIVIVRPGGGNLGPIIISGMDPEDHFPAGRDMIRDILYFVVKNSALHQTPTRIIMLGGRGSTLSTAASIASGLGFTLTGATGSAISSADLDPATTPYDVIYMPTTDDEISTGLLQSDLNLINGRSADIVQFVNKGGGLASFAQNLPGGYGWFPLGGLQTVNINVEGGGTGIRVTPDGMFILSASATQVEPFHQGFVGPAGFFGLKVLATQSTGLQRVLIIGGLADISTSPAVQIAARSSALSVACLANGCMELTFSAPDDGTYTIDASTDLVNWTPLTSVVAADGVIKIADPLAPAFPARFYRAIPKVSSR